MKTEDFDFYLPDNLIAQTPIEKRDNSKMLVLDKETGNIEHKQFHDVVDYLEENDILVYLLKEPLRLITIWIILN